MCTHANANMHKYTHIHRERKTDRQAGRQAVRWRKASRQVDRQIDRQKSSQTVQPCFDKNSPSISHHPMVIIVQFSKHLQYPLRKIFKAIKHMHSHSS